jgi:uncharacterized RDD family membrane protein YckC
MAKLILNPTSANRREISLGRSILSIGRDPSNDLVLPDAMVSRRHAVIESRGTQYYLRDCNSSNGSVINGDRVSERTLRDGDLVAIGTARLLFRDDILDSGAKVVPHPSSKHLECPSCQAEVRKGDLFCKECGAAIAQSGPPRAVCASCGSAVLLPARFCNACGAPLSPDRGRVEAPKPAPEPPASAPPDAVVPSRTPLLPLPSDEPATQPKGPLPGLSAPPPDPGQTDPPGGRFQGSSAEGPAVPGGPSSSSAIAAAPAMPPAMPSPLAQGPMRRPVLAPGPDKREPSRFVPADPGRRLGAALLDGLVVASGQALLLGPLAYYWASLDAADVAFLPVLASVTLSFLAVLLGAAYFVGFWGLRGATPGKELLGLVVIDEQGRVPIGPGRAALRFLGYLLSAASLGVGFLMIVASGQGLHDRVARTRVERRRPGQA